MSAETGGPSPPLWLPSRMAAQCSRLRSQCLWFCPAPQGTPTTKLDSPASGPRGGADDKRPQSTAPPTGPEPRAAPSLPACPDQRRAGRRCPISTPARSLPGAGQTSVSNRQQTFINKTVTRRRDGRTEPSPRPPLAWQERSCWFPRSHSVRGSPGQDGHRRGGHTPVTALFPVLRRRDVGQ